MARTRSRKSSESFNERLDEYAADKLTDAQKVAIAKRKYLIAHADEIKKAVDEGYSYPFIAEFATMELLKMDVPKSYTFVNKAGEEVEKETSFYPMDIKKFIEAE